MELTRAAAGEPEAFFCAHLDDETTDCIEWPFGTNGTGYGELWVAAERTSHLVHRLACEFRHGPPPAGKRMALHSCHNPRCFNGAHLRWGDHLDNSNDKLAAGREARNGGERGRNTRLTWDKVRRMRQLLREGRTQGSVAREFGVGTPHVSRIARNLTWKDDPTTYGTESHYP